MVRVVWKPTGRLLDELAPFIEAGALTPVIDRTYRFGGRGAGNGTTARAMRDAAGNSGRIDVADPRTRRCGIMLS